MSGVGFLFEFPKFCVRRPDGGERWQSIILALRPAVFDRPVPALDRAGFVQALAECSEPLRERPR